MPAGIVCKESYAVETYAKNIAADLMNKHVKKVIFSFGITD